MSLKLLDLEYLRSQGALSGQVLVTGSSFSVGRSSQLFEINGKVGVGTSLPDQKLTVVGGNIRLATAGTSIGFPDGTYQSTAAFNTVIAGITGSVQYNAGGQLGGSPDLFWDTSEKRLGIGTSMPRSTLQIIDVGYESTNRNVNDTSTIVLDSFPVPDYRSCHYIVQVTDETYSWFHTSQIMLVHDGIQAFKSEYNIVTTADKLGEFDCFITGGDVELVFTPFYPSPKNIKVIRTSIQP